MNRNRKILIDILNGQSIKDTAILNNLHPVSVRSILLREVKRLTPDLWEDGIKAGWNGTYRTPALSWLREKKDEILNVEEKSIIRPEKKVSESVIKAAITVLEKNGYQVSKK